MVMWEDPLDKFRISKSYAVVDINELISVLRGAENLSESGIEMMLQSLHHDVAQTGKYSPYEEEAVHFAIYSGAIGKEDATIIMQGPENRGYDDAFRRAFLVGYPLVNRAAQEQNAMNQGQYKEAPLPFTSTGQLNPAYTGEVRSTVAKQTGGKNRRNRKSTDFNPYDSNNRLVTQIVSSRHSDPFNPLAKGAPVEGFARWYEPAAKKLGYLPSDFNKKTGRPVDRFGFVVPAHYVHKNTITLNDRVQRNHIINMTKKLIDQGLSDAQVRFSILNDPMAFRHTSIIHHNPDSIHDMVRRKEQAMIEVQDGLRDDVDDEVSAVAPQPQIPHETIMHPKMLGSGKYYNQNIQSNLNMVPHRYPAMFLRDLTEHHGMTEDEAKQFLNNVKQGKDGPFKGKNPLQRFMSGLYSHHTKDGAEHPSWYKGERIPFEGEPISGTPEKPKEEIIQPTTEPTAVPSGPRTPLAGRPREGPTITPTPATTGDSLPPPITGQPGITEGNQNIPSTPRPDLSGITREGLARVLARVASTPASTQMREGLVDMGAAGRQFAGGVRDIYQGLLGKSEVETYLETVQYELAKAVIEDYTDIGKMDISDPVHIALVGSHIQRSTSDVITIYHTKGDWRNIAKSFGLDHEQVQMVKVAFHE